MSSLYPISKKIHATLLGIGKAVPAHSIAQERTAELASQLNCQTDKQRRILPVLYKKTRVKKRSSVLSPDSSKASNSFINFFPIPKDANDKGPGTQRRIDCYANEAPLLAQKASKDALMNSNVVAADITHLITVSCTGFKAPGFDIDLVKRLKLRPNIERTHIGFMGCHGLFNAIRVANSFALSDPHSKILICSVELCSLHFSYGWNPDQIVANALFADGASAAVIAPTKSTSLNIKSIGSYIFPESEDAMTWLIGDNGFEMSLSAKVPGLIKEHLRTWMTAWLKKSGLKLEGIHSWSIHPGGPRVLDAVQQSLSINKTDTEASREVLAQHGNMSSATVLFILDRIISNKQKFPCVALGFGPGLTAEAILIH